MVDGHDNSPGSSEQLGHVSQPTRGLKSTKPTATGAQGGVTACYMYTHTYETRENRFVMPKFNELQGLPSTSLLRDVWIAPSDSVL